MISNDIRQIWDYFNGGIACLPDTVNQQQLKSWFKGMGPSGHQDTQQHKGATVGVKTGGSRVGGPDLCV